MREEASAVFKLLEESPTIPKKEGEVYHVVSMQWWQEWKLYVGYSKLEGTPEDDLDNLKIHNDEDLDHPCQMNDYGQIKHM